METTKKHKRKCDTTLEELLSIANELSQYFLDNYSGDWELYNKVSELKNKAFDLKMHSYISGLNRE